MTDWMPIETAPRDGKTEVRIKTASGRESSCMLWFGPPHQGWWPRFGFPIRDNEATHWAPLTPPEEKP